MPQTSGCHFAAHLKLVFEIIIHVFRYIFLHVYTLTTCTFQVAPKMVVVKKRQKNGINLYVNYIKIKIESRDGVSYLRQDMLDELAPKKSFGDFAILLPHHGHALLSVVIVRSTSRNQLVSK